MTWRSARRMRISLAFPDFAGGILSSRAEVVRGRWPKLLPRRPRHRGAAGAVEGALHEDVLARARGLALGGAALVVGAVGAQVPGLEVVGQLDVEDGLQLLLQARVLDRGDGLDAVVEVPRHPVRRADEVLGPAGVGEAEDAGVLEEAADDADHPDGLALPRDARPQAADAAHDEVHLDAGRGRFVQRLDDLAVLEGVHLGDD